MGLRYKDALSVFLRSASFTAIDALKPQHILPCYGLVEITHLVPRIPRRADKVRLFARATTSFYPKRLDILSSTQLTVLIRCFVMNPLHSARFNKPIKITHHASARMMERDITDDLLFDLIETGEIRFKDEKHCWIFKVYANRQDNLICAATLVDDAVIVKTLMINWQLET